MDRSRAVTIKQRKERRNLLDGTCGNEVGAEPRDAIGWLGWVGLFLWYDVKKEERGGRESWVRFSSCYGQLTRRN